jgi:hypothetical protein
MVVNNRDIKPAQVVTELKTIDRQELGTYPSDFPRDDKIKSKVSSIKQDLKRKDMSNLI